MRTAAKIGSAVLALLLFATVPAFAFAGESKADNTIGHAVRIAVSNNALALATQIHSFRPKAGDYTDFVKFTATKGRSYQVQVYGNGASQTRKFRVTLYCYVNYRWRIVHGRNYVAVAGGFTSNLKKFVADETHSSKMTYAVKIQPFDRKKNTGSYYVAVTDDSTSVTVDEYDAADGKFNGATPMSTTGYDKYKFFQNDIYTYDFWNQLQLHSLTAGDVDFYSVEVPAGQQPNVSVFTGLYREYPVNITIYDVDHNVVPNGEVATGSWLFSVPLEQVTYYFSISSPNSFRYRVGVLYNIPRS